MKNLVSGLALLIAVGSIASCGEDSPLGGGGGGALAMQCGLTCKTLADAGGSISGIRNVDAFFGAALNFEAQAGALEAEIHADLVNIALALGVEGDVEAMGVAALQTMIEARITGGLDGRIEAGLDIAFVPPRCEVSASASVQAAARCDATVSPGSVMVTCEGTCEAEASAMATCTGMATLMCRGTAPSFDCTGECHGSCVVEGGASCSGTCMGTCMLEAEATCDGACMGTCMLDTAAACDGQCLGTGDEASCTGECQLNVDARCEGGCTGECRVRGGGTCSGTCMGSCELTAPGATCTGECRGECTYEPGGAMCEVGARARCTATGSATVMCNGMCEGNATPPSVSAECEATARAEAQFSAECTPPSVEIKYQLTAAGEAALGGAANADARATFEGQIQAVGKAFANLQARGAKAGAVFSTAVDLRTTGRAAVEAVLDGVGSGNLSASFNATCAINVLPAATTAITNAATRLEASGSAVAGVTTALTGGA